MRFFQALFVLIGMMFFYLSALKIFKSGEYGPLELFILGLFSIIIGQIFKSAEEVLKVGKNK